MYQMRSLELPFTQILGQLESALESKKVCYMHIIWENGLTKILLLDNSVWL